MLIFTESDLHVFLRSKGFTTNHKKHENENGVDVIAIKDGVSFLIEHKRAELRDNGAYRISGDVLGDILIISLPSGKWFTSLRQETSTTKTCRFLEIVLDGDS